MKAFKILLLISLFCLAVSFASASLTDGLYSYYNLNENSGSVVDSAANNNLINTGATAGVSGKIGNAYNFVLGSTYLTSSNNIPITGKQARTINYWQNIYPDSSATYYFFGWGVNDIDGAFGAFNSSNYLYLWAAADDPNSTIPLNLNNWQMITLIYDGNNRLAYSNGDLIFNQSSPNINTLSGTLYIGSNLQGENGIYNGKIDEFGIWNRTLSQSEINTLYNSGAGLTYPFTNNTPPTNYSYSCYQESSTVNNQTGIDGNCKQKYTGQNNQYNYGIEVIYTMPDGATNEGNIAFVKYATNQTYKNVTIPTACIDLINKQVTLRYGFDQGSNPFNLGYFNINCYNINSNSFYNMYDTGNVAGNTIAVNSTSSLQNGIDGNYLTGLCHKTEGQNNLGYFNDCSNTTGELWDEAIYWNITSSVIRFNIYNESNTSSLFYKNVSLIISNSTNTYSYIVNGTMEITPTYFGIFNAQIVYNSLIRNQVINIIQYPIITNYDFYLTDSSTTTLFTISDITSNQALENALIQTYKNINGSLTLIQSQYTDVTGKAQIIYSPNTEYQYTVTKTGYNTKTFILNPVLFDAYTIRLIQSTSTANQYTDAIISTGTKVFFSNTANNFSFRIASPNATLTSYSYTLTTPCGVNTYSGSSSSGSSNTTSIDLSCYTGGDTVANLSYTYQTNIGTQRTYTQTIPILTPKAGNFTIMSLANNTYGLGDFERIMIVTLIALAVVGVTMLLNPYVAMALGLFIFGFFTWTGFLSVYMVALPIIIGIVYLAWRRE